MSAIRKSLCMMRGGNSAQYSAGFITGSSASDCGTESRTTPAPACTVRYRFPPAPSGSQCRCRDRHAGEITYRAAVAAAATTFRPGINCMARTFGAPLNVPIFIQAGKRAGRRDRGAAHQQRGRRGHHIRITVNFGEIGDIATAGVQIRARSLRARSTSIRCSESLYDRYAFPVRCGCRGLCPVNIGTTTARACSGNGVDLNLAVVASYLSELSGDAPNRVKSLPA